MLRIAVCDDDLGVYEQIKECMFRYWMPKNREYEGKYYPTAESLLQAPPTYSILFLDIMLDKGNDGIAVGKELREQGNTALFIITTSRKDRTLDGYEATVFLYMIKPLHQDRVFQVLDAAIQHMEYDTDRYVLRHKQRTDYIFFKDIFYFESYQRKRYIVTKSHRFSSSATWAQIIKPVENNSDFFSPKKSSIINLNHVSSHNKHDVTMPDGRAFKFE